MCASSRKLYWIYWTYLILSGWYNIFPTMYFNFKWLVSPHIHIIQFFYGKDKQYGLIQYHRLNGQKRIPTCHLYFHLWGCSFGKTPVHTAKSLRKRLSSIDEKELDLSAQHSDLNLTQLLWEDLEHWLSTRPYHSTSLFDLTRAFVSEWEQIVKARFKIVRQTWDQKTASCYIRLRAKV